MLKYRVTLGETPVITEHEIVRQSSRHYVDELNRVWYKNTLRDYRWFDTYDKALKWIVTEYKMRKNLLEIEYESVCQTLSDVENELQSVLQAPAKGGPS